MQLLTERYANKRNIVQAHFQKLWTQTSMETESGNGLRKHLETTKEHLRSSEEVGEPEKWDSILVFLVYRKMDSESRKQWQLDNPGTDIPSWKQLGEFLDTCSHALESGNAKPSPFAGANGKIQPSIYHFHIIIGTLSRISQALCISTVQTTPVKRKTQNTSREKTLLQFYLNRVLVQHMQIAILLQRMSVATSHTLTPNQLKSHCTTRCY